MCVNTQPSWQHKDKTTNMAMQNRPNLNSKSVVVMQSCAVVKTLVFPITSIIYFRLIRKRNRLQSNHETFDLYNSTPSRSHDLQQKHVKRSYMYSLLRFLKKKRNFILSTYSSYYSFSHPPMMLRYILHVCVHEGTVYRVRPSL